MTLHALNCSEIHFLLCEVTAWMTSIIMRVVRTKWEKAMAPHSSTLAWKIPWMEEPRRLQSMGSLGVRHDWATSLSLIGEGNGSPLQCSCLENPRDGGAWWAAVYGVAQSQTRLKRLSSSSNNRTKWAILQEKLFKHYMNTSYYCCGANNSPPELQQCPPLRFPHDVVICTWWVFSFCLLIALITSSQLGPGAAEVSLDFLLWDSMRFNFSTAPFSFLPLPNPYKISRWPEPENWFANTGDRQKKEESPKSHTEPSIPFMWPGTLQGCSQTLVIPQPFCCAHAPPLITAWRGAGPSELVVPESEPLFRKPYKHVAK